jgi:hypothetical protein
MKSREAIDQIERTKALDFDLQKCGARIAETDKIVEDCSYAIKNK